ncbi:uncharacterized protein EV422DRAFT_519302 [Fimicolochytrium jonesii]|uniref:uncharacterized protein n=1 Tax=Fimicolochytrium jonesii TaxID=1396493 RepID=UPI0022FE5F94|nr:uncharacterized protein EV422DRAFT_519302 [Fimicolochytrium jonesii]KAI8824216.1 hypothetical protein EV422DRAFT_519302 [Fimicolochytrium jonesii]
MCNVKATMLFSPSWEEPNISPMKTLATTTAAWDDFCAGLDEAWAADFRSSPFAVEQQGGLDFGALAQSTSTPNWDQWSSQTSDAHVIPQNYDSASTRPADDLVPGPPSRLQKPTYSTYYPTANNPFEPVWQSPAFSIESVPDVPDKVTPFALPAESLLEDSYFPQWSTLDPDSDWSRPRSDSGAWSSADEQSCGSPQAVWAPSHFHNENNNAMSNKFAFAPLSGELDDDDELGRQFRELESSTITMPPWLGHDAAVGPVVPTVPTVPSHAPLTPSAAFAAPSSAELAAILAELSRPQGAPEEPFPSETRRAGSSDDLKVHFCKHAGCGRKFTRKYNLKSHCVAAHSGTRPYVCCRCKHSFARKHDLVRHERSVHLLGPLKHVCSCGKAFARSDACKRHKKMENHA